MNEDRKTDLPLYIETNKRVGETPLECLNRFKLDNPLYKDLPLTYAGRLDPLAEGVLVILAGEKRLEKEKYNYCDKEYTADILFGINTDTHDYLGLADLSEEFVKDFTKGGGVEGGEGEVLKEEMKDKIKEKILSGVDSEVKKFVGDIKQIPPLFSSKNIAVLGLDRIKDFCKKTFSDEKNAVFCTTKDVKVYEMEVTGKREVAGSEILEEVLQKIPLVTGSFRQKEITERWKEILRDSNGDNSHISNIKFPVISLRIKCSGGFYVRALARDLGEAFGTSAIASRIKRTKIFSENQN
ncbi:MAG: hypothetical protein Q7R78_01200 [bacterium]|nr:hypothetical protein [bacterium]